MVFILFISTTASIVLLKIQKNALKFKKTECENVTELISEWFTVLLQTAGVPRTAGPGTHKHLSHRRRLSVEQRRLITMQITTSLRCLQRRDGAGEEEKEEEVDKNGSLGHSPNMTTQA